MQPHLLSRSRTAKHPRMPSFRNGKVEIAYLDEGEGGPIVLIHGFASTKEVNWLLTSWFATLTKAGRRTIALDNRGHGASTKLYDPADYPSAIMAEDVRGARSSGDRACRFDGLFDGLAHRRVSVGDASRARAFGDTRRAWHSSRVEGVGLPESIAEALEAPTVADVKDPTGRTFRVFAEQTKSDLRALAACIRGSRQG